MPRGAGAASLTLRVCVWRDIAYESPFPLQRTDRSRVCAVLGVRPSRASRQAPRSFTISPLAGAGGKADGERLVIWCVTELWRAFSHLQNDLAKDVVGFDAGERGGCVVELKQGIDNRADQAAA